MEKQIFSIKAPTRVDLAGGTLDLWPLYCLHGEVRTINLAIDLFAKAHFETTPSPIFQIEMGPRSGKPVRFTEPYTLEQCKNLPREVRFPVAIISQYLSTQKEFPKTALRITWESDVPMGSGLGGSSTLAVALTRGISRLFHGFSDQGWQWRMLAWVRDAEAAFLGLPTGTQDYLSALFGGLNCFGSRLGEIVREVYPEDCMKELGERMLVVFSGEQHQSGLSNWEVFKGAMEGKPAILSGINRLAEIANQLDNELRSRNLSWKRVGQYLHEEWRVRREVFQVHTERLDSIVNLLMKNQVFGVKVCGAAQGGSLLAVVNPEQRLPLSKELRKLGIQVLDAAPCSHGVTVV